MLGGSEKARAAMHRLLKLKPDFAMAWVFDTYHLRPSSHRACIEAAAVARVPLRYLRGLQVEPQ